MSGSVSIFDLVAGTSTVAADVLVYVDTTDSTQSPQGSTKKITTTNFFATIAVPVVVTSSSATALAVGRQGSTNPALLVDASTASSATGLKVKSAAAAAGVAVSVVSSGADENLKIDAKGAGTVTIASVSTGAVTIGAATSVTGQVVVTVSSAVADPLTVNNTVSTAASFRSLARFRRNSTTVFYIATDASDQFVLTNAAGNAANLTVTDAGALTVRDGISATTGTFSDSVSVAATKFVYLNGQGGNSNIRESATGTVVVTVGGTALVTLTTLMTLNCKLDVAQGLSVGAAAVPDHGIAFGSSAPSSLADGQIWYDGTNLKARLGGATRTITVS